jgi:LmbE family N-acetylglucosaminyl deacetylase
MATLVFFHAHPDDEVFTTGGSMARAAAEGHRVVLVVATDGAHGEVPDDLDPDETLVDRRWREVQASAAVLGAAHVERLGYRDSGMTGWIQNDDPAAFHRADVDAAASQLAALLRRYDATVLTSYDWHGNYGHPDHVKVHVVAKRAAELVEGVRLVEATANRDEFLRMMTANAPAAELDFDPSGPADDGNPFGTAESELTLAVDVRDHVHRKREALRCHRSQVTDTSPFLEMPDDVFAAAFGTEWFIETDRDPPYRTGWLLDPDE